LCKIQFEAPSKQAIRFLVPADENFLKIKFLLFRINL